MSKNAEYTSLTLPAEFIGNPLKYVATYFDYKWKSTALNTLHDHLMAVLKPKRRKKLIQRSSDQLYHMQTFIKLLEAMWLLWQEDTAQDRGTIPEDFQDPLFLFDKHFYTREKERDDWLAMPRYLSEEEFFTPMITVDLFFKRHSLSKWKSLLDEILHNILSTGVGGFDNEYTNLYEVHFFLACLIEASYLIHIRQQDVFINYLSSLQQALITSPGQAPQESGSEAQPNDNIALPESTDHPPPAAETT